MLAVPDDWDGDQRVMAILEDRDQEQAFEVPLNSALIRAPWEFVPNKSWEPQYPVKRWLSWPKSVDDIEGP